MVFVKVEDRPANSLYLEVCRLLPNPQAQRTRQASSHLPKHTQTIDIGTAGVVAPAGASLTILYADLFDVGNINAADVVFSTAELSQLALHICFSSMRLTLNRLFFLCVFVDLGESTGVFFWLWEKFRVLFVCNQFVFKLLLLEAYDNTKEKQEHKKQRGIEKKKGAFFFCWKVRGFFLHKSATVCACITCIFYLAALSDNDSFLLPHTRPYLPPTTVSYTGETLSPPPIPA